MNKLKEHIILVTAIVIIISIMLLIQYYVIGLNKGFWVSLIPNIIVDMISILIASYFVTHLIQKNRDKKVKENTYKLLGKKFSAISTRLADYYIKFVTKGNYRSGKDETLLFNKVKEVYSNINNYVDKDFANKDIKVITVKNYYTLNPNEWAQEESWDYQKFTFHFKKVITEDINKFISCYITVLPEELIKKLLQIENYFLHGYFITPNEYGLKAQFADYNIEINEEELKKMLFDFGKEICDLLVYFEDEKNK